MTRPFDVNTRARLAVVVSHPTQYYSPWFREFARTAGGPFRVFYCWDAGVRPAHDPQFGTTFAWDVDLLSGYDHEFSPNRARPPSTERFGGLRNPDLTRRLDAWKPDALLVFGYAFRSHLAVIAWARRRALPLIFRGDSHFLGRGPPRGGKGLLLRLLYRQFSAVTYVGQANREYFTTLGVDSDRLFFAPHGIDRVRFDPTRADVRKEAVHLRAQHGIPPEHQVVLFAGKLMPSKQPRALLDAFRTLSDSATHLVFVGEGEEKDPLIQAAKTDRAREKRVHFLPFANQSEMPARYAMADLFVLPSRGFYETWGLAVQEAMHLGVPCLVSTRVGCQRDLVVHRESGWTFDPDTPDDLARTLALALSDLRANRIRFREAALNRVSHYTYAQTTAGVEAALRHVLRARIQ